MNEVDPLLILRRRQRPKLARASQSFEVGGGDLYVALEVDPGEGVSGFQQNQSASVNGSR